MSSEKLTGETRVPQAIRTLRTKIGASQADFARVLDSQRNSVSRWETGRIVPSTFVLIRLHDLAHMHGAVQEEIVFLKALKSQPGIGVLGSLRAESPDSPVDTFAFFRGGEEIKAWESQEGVTTLRILPGGRIRVEGLPEGKNREDFLRLLGTVGSAVVKSKQIDDSVIEILRLWVERGSHKGVERHFRDAAAYLRVQLSGKRRKKPTRSSRVSISSDPGNC